MRNVKKYLAIDVGKKRFGLATCNSESKIPLPHSTIEFFAIEQICYDIIEIIKQEQITDVLIGMPISDNAKPSSMAGFIKKFHYTFCELLNENAKTYHKDDYWKKLAKNVRFVDERYTTKIAHSQMHELGLKPSENRNIVDQMAAVNILSNI